MKNKYYKWSRWVLVNGAFMGAVLLMGHDAGTFGTIAVATLTGLFLSLAVLMAMTMYAIDQMAQARGEFDKKSMKVIDSMQSKYPNIPRAIDVTYDMVMLSAFYFFGWHYVGTMYALFVLAQIYAIDKAQELKSKAELS